MARVDNRKRPEFDTYPVTPLKDCSDEYGFTHLAAAILKATVCDIKSCTRKIHISSLYTIEHALTGKSIAACCGLISFDEEEFISKCRSMIEEQREIIRNNMNVSSQAYNNTARKTGEYTNE